MFVVAFSAVADPYGQLNVESCLERTAPAAAASARELGIFRIASSPVFLTPTPIQVEETLHPTSERRTHHVAVGDVNGDGYPDLVVSNPSDLVVLLGNGDGTFGPPSLIATLGSAGLVKLGDFNGDGRLDILVLDSGDGGFWILLNNGAGSFSTPVVYSGIVSLPSDVAIADINGDGILDVMISDASRFTSQIGLALGRSDGSFAPIAPVDLTSLLDGVNEIAVVDFNGDGQRDIAGTLSGASGTAQNIVLLYGKGDGEFEPPKTLGPVGAPHGFAAADLNGDGVPDLSVVFSNRILTFLMRRNGTFGLFAYPGPELSATVTIADVNGDGLPDMIAAGVETGEIWLYVGTSCGTFQTPILFPSGAQLPFKITVADVNGDGAPDLIISDHDSNTVSLVLNAGESLRSRRRVVTH